MKKIIFRQTLSLDGYFEGPGGEIEWHVVDDDHKDCVIDLLGATDAILMGRKSYELMARFWPQALVAGKDALIKEKMNSLPKLVFSRTLKRVKWQNCRLATGAPAEEAARLRKEPGDGLLLVGGSDLAAAFLAEGLLDELRVMMTPVLLGGGHAVLDAIKRRHALKLLSTKTFKSGNVELIYAPAARS